MKTLREYIDIVSEEEIDEVDNNTDDNEEIEEASQEDIDNVIAISNELNARK